MHYSRARLLKRDGRDHSSSMKQPAVVPSALAGGSQPAASPDGLWYRPSIWQIIAKIKWFKFFLPHSVDRLSLSLHESQCLNAAPVFTALHEMLIQLLLTSGCSSPVTFQLRRPPTRRLLALFAFPQTVTLRGTIESRKVSHYPYYRINYTYRTVSHALTYTYLRPWPSVYIVQTTFFYY